MGKISADHIQKIVDYLKDMQYGTMLITVHNEEITQLDITRKQRLEKPKQL